MAVGLLTFELQLTYTHSLKEKRAVLQRLLTRLRARFNVAVAELDHQDAWQRAAVGVVSISSNPSLLESSLRQILAESERILGQDVENYNLEFF
jgi:uncharacterized protein